ncbi:MAG: hypothetical protein NC900_05695 [Candidatus Omnitrophica bacterium]|nr:hypothetical protein [Candidatus Omnitrophota bacterium]
MRKRIFIISAVILFYSGFFSQAYSSFNLSVRPYEGGYELKFGKIEPSLNIINKEVVVNIISDLGKPYRLIQEVLEPLTNQEGVVIPLGNFFVYALRGTNRYGTLSVEQETPVSLGRTIIYTSNSLGLSDSFTLVYSLRGPLGVPAGLYRGRIAFILESTETGQMPVINILNVYVDISAQAYIRVVSKTGSKVIALSSKTPEKSLSQISLEMKYPLGGTFRIYQSITEPLVSVEGKRFPLESISFYISGAHIGTAPNVSQPLSLKDELLYTSDLKGNAENFSINYQLGDVSGIKAGIYRTTIKYLLEGPGSSPLRLLDTYNLEVNIPAVFELMISTPTGGKVIEFRNLKPEEPPKRFEVDIEVKTNLEKQYQVSQNLVSALSNREGKTIPSKFFTLRTEGIDAKGKLLFPHNTEVKIGEMVLYISDREGLPAKFKVIYELSSSWDIAAGDYSAPIIYSVTEL